MTELAPLPTPADPRSAIVIGAGLGGLAAAMRLGAKGYRVTVLDKLDRPGGRGSSITRGGHRFDLGPTIVTVPEGLRQLWAACGRNFDVDVRLVAMDPFYEIRWQDGSRFAPAADDAAARAEVARLSPGDVAGYDKFLRDAEARYEFGYEDLGKRPMHKLWDLIQVLPKFAGCAPTGRCLPMPRGGSRMRGCALPCRSIRCSSAAIRSTSPRCTSWSAIWSAPLACTMRWAGCRRLPRRWCG